MQFTLENRTSQKEAGESLTNVIFLGRAVKLRGGVCKGSTNHMKTTSCPVQALFSVGCQPWNKERRNYGTPPTTIYCAVYMSLYTCNVCKKITTFFSNTPRSLACLHQKPALLGGVMEARIEANAGLFLGKHWALKLAVWTWKTAHWKMGSTMFAPTVTW